MYRKAKIWILAALVAAASVMPVSAAETADVTTDESTVTATEETQTDSMLTPDGNELVVDMEGSDGETSLPQGNQLELVQEEQQGSITVSLTSGKDGTSISGVSMACTKVADIVNGEYVLTEEFQSSGVDLNNIQNASDMESAAMKLEEMLPEGTNGFTTSGNGEITFAGLDVGVYLVSAVDDSSYDEVTPSLIAVPTWSEEDGEMQYTVVLQPKHTERPDEETPATETPERTTTGAPQTNAYSPVLLFFGGAAAVAVFAVIINVIFRMKNKK